MTSPWASQTADYLLNGTWQPQSLNQFELIILGLDVTSLNITGNPLSNAIGSIPSAQIGAMSIPSVASIQTATTLKLSVESVNLPTRSYTYEKLRKRFNTKKAIFSDYEFGDLTVTLRDDVFQDIARIIENWQDAVFDPRTGRVGNPTYYKKTGCLCEFSPDGTKVRFYVFKGLTPVSNTYSGYSFQEGGYKTIDLSLSCDAAYPSSAAEIINDGFSISMFT